MHSWKVFRSRRFDCFCTCEFSTGRERISDFLVYYIDNNVGFGKFGRFSVFQESHQKCQKKGKRENENTHEEYDFKYKGIVYKSRPNAIPVLDQFLAKFDVEHFYHLNVMSIKKIWSMQILED